MKMLLPLFACIALFLLPMTTEGRPMAGLARRLFDPTDAEKSLPEKGESDTQSKILAALNYLAYEKCIDVKSLSAERMDGCEEKFPWGFIPRKKKTNNNFFGW